MKKNHIPSFLLSVSILYFAALLTGCSNNNGGSTENPDTKAPYILTVDPAANKTDVGINYSVSVQFNEAIKESTIDSSTFTIYDGIQNIEGDITYADKTATFKPKNPLSASKRYSATIGANVTDRSNNKMGKEFSWNFTTSGALKPDIIIKKSKRLVLSGDSNAHDFGGVQVSRQSSIIYFTIENFGSAALNINSASISIPDYIITQAPDASVSPGGKTDIALMFNPQSTGIKTGMITIANNDTLKSSYTFAVTGSATLLPEPEINLQVGGINIPSGTLGRDFGSVKFLSQSPEVYFTIQNIGGDTLTISDISSSSPDFIIASVPNSVSSNSDAAFTIQFKPQSVGTKIGTITITNNDSDEGIYTFSVNGVATEADNPAISVKNGSTAISSGISITSFQSATINTTGSSFVFTIQNSGTADLNMPGTPIVQCVNQDGSANSDFTIEQPMSSLLLPGVSESFTITFTPKSIGTISATIKILSNDPNTPAFIFTAQGISTAAPVQDIAIMQGTTTLSNGGSYLFPNTDINKERSITFSIKNKGNADLTMQEPYFTITGDADFTITPATLASSIINGGGGVTFTVTFKPTSGESKSATVIIRSNDPEDPNYQFTINGTGTIAYGIDSSFNGNGTVGTKGGVFYPYGIYSSNNRICFTDINNDNITSMIYGSSSPVDFVKSTKPSFTFTLKIETDPDNGGNQISLYRKILPSPVYCGSITILNIRSFLGSKNPEITVFNPTEITIEGDTIIAHDSTNSIDIWLSVDITTSGEGNFISAAPHVSSIEGKIRFDNSGNFNEIMGAVQYSSYFITADNKSEQVKVFQKTFPAYSVLPDIIYLSALGIDSVNSILHANNRPYISKFSPSDIAISDDYIYILDDINSIVIKTSLSDGTLSILSISQGYGSGNGQLNLPQAISASDGLIYLADTFNNRIEILNGTDLSHNSSIGSSGTLDNQFISPYGIHVSGTTVFVSDSGNNCIKLFNKNTGEFISKTGSYGSGNGQFKYPARISSTASHLFVSDPGNRRIQMFDISTLSHAINIEVAESGNLFVNPTAIAVDSSYIYVVDGGDPYIGRGSNQRIKKINKSTGASISTFGSFGTLNGEFNSPCGGIALDSAGNIYVSDTYNNRIDVFTSALVYKTSFGSIGSGDSNFKEPMALASDSVSGTLHIADTLNSSIKQYDISLGAAYLSKASSTASRGISFDASTGKIYSLEKSGSSMIVKEHGTTPRFSPDFKGVSIASLNGLLYLTCTDHMVRVVNPTDWSLLAEFGSLGSNAGQFNSPSGIAVDSAENIYVVDTKNHRIQKFKKL